MKTYDVETPIPQVHGQMQLSFKGYPRDITSLLNALEKNYGDDSMKGLKCMFDQWKFKCFHKPDRYGVIMNALPFHASAPYVQPLSGERCFVSIFCFSLPADSKKDKTSDEITLRRFVSHDHAQETPIVNVVTGLNR